MFCLIFMAVMIALMARRGVCIPMSRASVFGPPAGRETPREILDRWLASGEMQREQYLLARHDLELR